MAWFDGDSVFSFGKHKGKKVKEVDDSNYIHWLHHSKLNVYFVQDVFDRLGINNTGLLKQSKTSDRIR